MATILRLLPGWALLAALLVAPAPRATAAEGDGTSVFFSTVPEVTVPLGPVIYYIVPGPQPSAWVTMPSLVSLQTPGTLPANAEVEWYKNGQKIVGANGPLHALGLITKEDAGYYQASVAPSAGGFGYGIQLEVLDPREGSRLENSSLRAAITAESPQIIGGIVVGPQRGYAVLVRAVGPSLEDFDVSNPLPDPVLHFFDANGNSADGHILGASATMIGIPTIEELVEAARLQVGAFPLRAGAADVAYLVAFPPGAYTAQVTSASGATGDVLLEFYDVRNPPGVVVP